MAKYEKNVFKCIVVDVFVRHEFFFQYITPIAAMCSSSLAGQYTRKYKRQYGKLQYVVVWLCCVHTCGVSNDNFFSAFAFYSCMIQFRALLLY